MNELQRRLEEFVDRSVDMGRFCSVLETPKKPVMAVWGPGGIGKSSLMARMIHECANRSCRKVEVIYTEDSIHDYLAIMRKCRDDLTAEGFLAFTDLINYYHVKQYNLKIETGAGEVEVANQMQVGENARVGNIAGVVVNINELNITDFMSSSPRSDLDVSEPERRRKLTDKFLQNLAETAADGGVIVVFIDGVERMTPQTRGWLWDSFVAGVAEREMANVRFVILGRTEPELDRYKKPLVVLSQLTPLGKDDVIEYLGKRGVPESERLTMARTLMGAHKGDPLKIATTVDQILEEAEDEP